jgi:hypothetical protein
MEIFGKIIEFDLDKYPFVEDVPVVTRFNELPESIQESLTLIAKGVRNISGITFQKFNNQYIKYIGNVGQRTVEAVYSFIHYRSIPVIEIVQASMVNSEVEQEGFINFGWRGWEGMFPTLSATNCSGSSGLSQETINYYDEAVKVSTLRLPPLTCFLHEDPRPGKFHGTAITGVRPYMGYDIPELTGNIVFTNLAAEIEEYRAPVSGTLAYTNMRTDCKLNDFSVIDIDYDFGSESAYFVGMGSNLNQTKLYLGVYGAHSVIDLNKGTIFEIVP